MAKKILLADDSATMRKVFEMTFAAEDATITAVASGSEAISRAREMKPDVVVADLSMPGKNAYDVCAELKADPALAGIPVLILHGSSAGYDEAKARSVKADGEIAKPFETQALIEKLDGLMASSGALPTAPHEPMGPITSLSSPIEAPDSDILIDTEEEPARPAASASAEPARPPASPPATPAAAAMPIAKLGPTPPPRPPAFVPPAPPPKPPAFLAPQAPPKPSAAPPKSPPPKAVPVAKPESLEVEITIEAEMPAEGSKATELPSFDGPVTPPPVIEASRERPSATILGLGKPDLPAPPQGLPPPPAGLPMPPPGLPLPPPKPSPVAAAVTAPAAELEKPEKPAPPLREVPSRPVAIPAPEPLVVVAPEPAPVVKAPPSITPSPPVIEPAPPPVVELPPLQPGRPYEPVAYEAIAKLSREVIERIVWEVVPDLAERIIREELDRLVEGRRGR